MNVTIVVPTYNEAKNIGRLITAVDNVVKNTPNHKITLLVVDDSSPDDTADIVEKASASYPFVKLLLRKEKTGLGSAYTEAFRYAINHFDPEILIEMDADFQHDPEDLPRFIKAIEDGADFVLGSRYINGGSIPEDWAFYRKLLSIWGNRFTKLSLGIFNITDFTTGYRASRVKGFVDKMDLSAVLSKGFAYKIDLLFRMHRLGAKITEIPIVFGLRAEGESKMQQNNPTDTLKVIFLLRFKEKESFFKFLIVGTVGFITDFALFNVFSVSTTLRDVSAILSGFFAMSVTLLLNNLWSFQGKTMGKKMDAVWKTALYFISSTLPIFLRHALVGWGSVNLGDTFIIRNAVFIFGVGLGLLWNYFIYSKVIWSKPTSI